MKKAVMLVVPALLLSSSVGWSQDNLRIYQLWKAKKVRTFVPPNKMSVSVDSPKRNGMTEELFNKILDHAYKVYKPIFEKKGAEFVIERDWKSSVVNAYATQQGKKWIIKMFGGLARHETVTADGFAVVACHEIGHHLGGAPLYKNIPWASNEGQSDFFSTGKCMRRLIRDQESLRRLMKKKRPSSDQEEFAKKTCIEVWGEKDRFGRWKKDSEEEAARCVRGSMAGMSLAMLFRALRKEKRIPRFDEPDPKEVPKTSDRHPATQCRLDSYFQGALCTVDMEEDTSKTDPKAGYCVRGEYETGLRPRCWYKPPSEDISWR